MRSGTRTEGTLASHLPLRANLRFAARNVLRHKGRTGTTLAAVVFGVVALILSRGFIEDTFVQLGEAIIHSQTGHLQIGMTGYFAQGMNQPEKFLLPDPAGEQREITMLPQVMDVMARLNFSGLLNNERADYSILGEGIEADKEGRLGTFLHVAAGRNLMGSDHYHLLIGNGVAQALKLAPGDRAILLVSTSGGAMNTLDFEVVGVFQTFSKDYDERVVKLPLSTAQELLATAGANTLVVSLKNTADTTRVAAALASKIAERGQEVKTWQELNDFYPKTVDLYQRLFGGLQIIILLMVLLTVVNAVNMTVFERTAEFGTARALGNRATHVFQIVVLENALIGTIGGALGVLLGVTLALGISSIGIPMPPPPNADLGYTALVRVTPGALAGAFATGLLATILAALRPAFKVSRMHIVDALRQNA